jgi:hypothetical protein
VQEPKACAQRARLRTGAPCGAAAPRHGGAPILRCRVTHASALQPTRAPARRTQLRACVKALRPEALASAIRKGGEPRAACAAACQAAARTPATPGGGVRGVTPR